MIYRLYYNPDLALEADAVHRYGEFLLGYAFYQEKRLCYSQQAIISNEWGKPALRDHPQIQFNISHCKGMACCILADVPVGIDAEYVRPFSSGAARHVLSPPELDDIRHAKDPNRRFFLYWTLKESCVKAMGIGLAYSMKKVIFCVEDDDIRCLTLPEFRFIVLENSGPYITSVCYRQAGQSKRIYENI